MKRVLVAAVVALALAGCSKPKGNAETTAVSDMVQVPADRLTSTPSTTAPDGTPNSDLTPAPPK